MIKILLKFDFFIFTHYFNTIFLHNRKIFFHSNFTIYSTKQIKKKEFNEKFSIKNLKFTIKFIKF